MPRRASLARSAPATATAAAAVAARERVKEGRQRPPLLHIPAAESDTDTEKVNLAQKLALFDEHWQPKIVAGFNGNDVRIVKVKGEFVWHKHDDTDDFFLVLKGHLTIQLRDGDVELDEGELYVVPRGVEHCPRAEEEAHVLLIEPAGTINTGDAGGPLTAEPRPI
jgi:mannose-6-phosphate isomerase-like protein (cupin superfamily)